MIVTRREAEWTAVYHLKAAAATCVHTEVSHVLSEYVADRGESAELNVCE